MDTSRHAEPRHAHHPPPTTHHPPPTTHDSLRRVLEVPYGASEASALSLRLAPGTKAVAGELTRLQVYSGDPNPNPGPSPSPNPNPPKPNPNPPKPNPSPPKPKPNPNQVYSGDAHGNYAKKAVAGDVAVVAAAPARVERGGAATVVDGEGEVCLPP
jgi:hypothetical protein